jgi:hypothetical protein
MLSKKAMGKRFGLLAALVAALVIACAGVVVAQSSTADSGYENPNAVTTPGAGAQSASDSASNVTVTTTGVPNGNFETGDFTHWNGANQIQGSGDWFVYEGTESPLSGFNIAAPPARELCCDYRSGRSWLSRPLQEHKTRPWDEARAIVLPLLPQSRW